MKKQNLLSLVLISTLLRSGSGSLLVSASEDITNANLTELVEVTDTFNTDTNPSTFEQRAARELAEEPETLALNETFVIDNITYKIIAEGEKNEVSATTCNALVTDLNIPATVTHNETTYRVTTIPEYAFNGRSRVIKITLPEGMTTVAPTAFLDCYNVTEIQLPATLETFTYAGFQKLKTITLADGNTHFQLIDDVLFSIDGTNLHLYPSAKEGTSYVTPAGATTICEAAFLYNQNLTDLTLSDSVTTVDGYAFYNSDGLVNFSFGENVSTFALGNLYECDNLKSVVLKGTAILANDCIAKCPKLETITIDGQVRGYGPYSLYNLPNLKEYKVLSSNYYNAKDGVLFNGDDLLRYPSAKATETYVVPESTTEISPLAFNYTQNLKTVILPPNATIGTQAFNYPSSNPLSIYFRDSEKVKLSTSASGVFVSLAQGSHLYAKNQSVVDSIHSYSSAITPAGSVGVEIKTIPATKLDLQLQANVLNTSETITCKTSIEPYYATDNIAWSSSDKNIATVEGNGKVTGKAPGKVTITARAGSATDTATITVKAPLKSIALSNTSLQLNKGDQKTLSVSYVPSNTTDPKAVTWSSTNHAIASVDQNGKITAKAVGVATITAKTNTGKTATCKVQVISKPVVPPKPPEPSKPIEIAKPTIQYRTHVQTFGWQNWVSNGQLSGTSGKAKRLEGINIKLSSPLKDGGIEYSTHVQTYGWQGWKTNGSMSGTSGEAKRLEAIKIKLTGKLAEQYDVYYRVHVQSFGWLDWAKNGAPSGTEGYAKRLEGIQIQVVRKGASAPGNTSKTFLRPNVMYKTHVQTFGWQPYVLDGAMSGTSGLAKRLEGIQIKNADTSTSGSIQYKTHVQTYGWQGWKADGAISGTSGEAKRLEAIQIKLTGALAQKYDVYYRVHVQSLGWLDWAKNGASSGTAGMAKRLEGIEIRYVSKGAKAPGSTTRPFIQ